jgi:hypothetical protein
MKHFGYLANIGHWIYGEEEEVRAQMDGNTNSRIVSVAKASDDLLAAIYENMREHGRGDKIGDIALEVERERSAGVMVNDRQADYIDRDGDALKV